MIGWIRTMLERFGFPRRDAPLPEDAEELRRRQEANIRRLARQYDLPAEMIRARIRGDDGHDHGFGG